MTNSTQNPLVTAPARVEFGGGEHIDRAAIRLCEAAAEHGEAFGTFNDIELHAAAGCAPDGVVKFFREECKRRSDAWSQSPEGIRAAKERDKRRADLQAKHDALMKRLPKLDWSDRHAVLDWLCEMQRATNHIGVIVKRDTIVDAFEKRSYSANMNTGKDYKAGDRVNMHQYLVGQALAGLKEGPSIHPILHKFADEWRKEFPRV